MKYPKYLWFAGAFLASPLMGAAQQAEPLAAPSRLFEEGKQLFLQHNYAASRQTLSDYLKQAPQSLFADEAAYMLACTAYELKSADCIGQLSRYLDTYPASRHANRVQWLIGSSYFFQGKYPESVANLKACDLDKLADDERDTGLLRLGTAYLKMGNLREAGVWFATLREVSRRYRPDATYHLAYIAYVNRNYDEALQGFRSAASDERYAALSPYYIADILLKQGNYAQAKAIATTYPEAFPGQEKAAQMKRIAGEACYGLKQYPEAAGLLETYCKEVGAKAERLATYKLGMSYFYMGVYSEAAARLNETVAGQDALTQNAYLHIGLSYLQLKERDRSRQAFEQAASMAYDPHIREQSLYNYALCLHETSYSPFAESVTVFERFLNEFPNSPYAPKVNDYLIEVYMSTRSYMAALRSIEKISHPGERILEAKQKLLFRLGTQAFAQAAFENAVDCFSQSLALGRYDQQTKADAYYWRGEAKYRLEQYADAANDLRQYLEFAPGKQSTEYGLALYNLGYTAFKLKQYEQALAWFSRCAGAGTKQDKAVMADTYNRMGDCFFYARRFDEAKDSYARAAITDPALGDYSLFQQGFVCGLQHDYNGKVEILNRLLAAYPSSPYADDALYEQGRAFVMLEDNENAIKRYSLLTGHFPESPLSRKASIETGLLYYQDDQYKEAIDTYKKVITSYPGSEEARIAQRDLKSIYIDLNRIDDYAAFAATIPGGANFDVNERDSLTYVAAERAYMRGDAREAQESFVRYLQSFPEGAFSLNAHYYLGLAAYKESNYADASAHLGKVMQYPDNKFSEEAMEMCADMCYKMKEYAQAASIYKQLADRASSQEKRLHALAGTLRSAWMAGETGETIAAASTLLAENKLAPEIAAEAHYYRAKSLLAENKSASAMEDLGFLAKDTRNIYGAEAKYVLAQLYFDGGDARKAEQEVLDYIETSTPHTYWLARSFVLLADVYTQMGRRLEAKQYLLSLKQNYQADDDIAGMIAERLEKLNKDE